MADFDVLLLGGSTQAWVDPPSLSPAAPSRLNPDPAYQASFRLYAPPHSVQILALLGGVPLLDSALAGALYAADWSEWSGPYPPQITYAVGQSSAIFVQLDAVHVGHFLLRVRRAGHGALLVPFEAG